MSPREENCAGSNSRRSGGGRLGGQGDAGQFARQAQAELGALLVAAQQVEAAAMVAHQVRRDGKAQARAALARTVILSLMRWPK